MSDNVNMTTNRSPFLFSVTSIAAALLLGACDGGGGPKIKSFEASQTALPEGGAEVTFTWDVTGEKSLTLNPYPGAVTGTSATVTVTEAQVFTLVAKKDGKKDTKKIAFTVGEAFVVTGQAVDYRGRPIPGVQVFVDDQFFVTDMDGFFVAENVVPPYDLGQISTGGGGPALGGSGELDILIYQGVTRPDPVILVNGGLPTNGFATVTGAVTGGAGFPPPPNHATSFDVAVPGGSAGSGFDSSTGAYNVDLYWHDPDHPQPFILGAIQYNDAPGGLVYTGFGRTPGMATDDQSITNLNVALNPVSTEDMSVTVGAPWDVTEVYVYPELTLGPPSGPEGAVLGGLPIVFAERYELPYAYASSAATIGFAVPGDVPGSSISVYTNVYGPDGSGYAYFFNRAPGSTFDVTMPAIPTLLTPVDGGSITPATVFSVAPVESAVYVHFLDAESFSVGASLGAPPPDIDITLYTSSSSFAFPEGLEEFGVSLDGREFEWRSTAIVGFDGIDGLVEDGGIPPGDVLYTYADDSRYLIYGTRGSKGPI